jgi:hypothetical protein
MVSQFSEREQRFSSRRMISMHADYRDMRISIPGDAANALGAAFLQPSAATTLAPMRRA